MERIGWILGRCHEMVHKIEQLHSFSREAGELMHLSQKLSSYIDNNKSNF